MMAPRHHRRHERPKDMRQVMDAAALLGLREFDLFRLAWRSWSGVEPDGKALEKFFVDYMFHHVVPPWVRHFCREILAREKEGRLDPAAFGVERVPRRELPVALGRAYIGVAAAAMLLLFPLLQGFGPAGPASATLACDLGPGMRLFAGLAHVLADRQAPACPRGTRSD
jgi:hypothetical protein